MEDNGIERRREQNLVYNFLRVVEMAAIAAARTMGRGERKYSDQVAVETMRAEMDLIPMQGRIVIGEGERDEAPMLYIGEHVLHRPAVADDIDQPLRRPYLLLQAVLFMHQMFALQGETPTVYAASMLMIFMGSFVFGWLFVRSRGSLVVAWLAHVGVHFDNPTRAIEQTATPYLVFVAATLRSRRARIKNVSSASRAIAESASLVMASVVAPPRFAFSRVRLMSVPAPDCEMPMTSASRKSSCVL